MIKKSLFTFPIIFMLCFQSTFGASGEVEKTQTIREIQENIQVLEKEKDRLEFRWNTFQIGNDSLGDLMKQELSFQENSELETLVLQYTETKKLLERLLEKTISSGHDIEETKIDLLLLKQDFYKNLIPYIQKEKLESFTSYVNSDVTYNEKSKQVATEIEQKSVKITQRVEEIQDKAEDNYKPLFKGIEEKIVNKISQKLDTLISEEKFSSLEDDIKVKIFKKYIDRFENEIKRIDTIENPTSIIEEKIALYEVIVEILESYIVEW